MARTNDPHSASVKAWQSRARSGEGSAATASVGDFAAGGIGGGGWKSSTGVSYDPTKFDLDGDRYDTERAFKPDGTWDPKRLAEVHQPIVESFVKDIPKSRTPTIYLLGGGPASGKSTLQRQSLIRMPEPGEAALSNPDEIRYKLPEWGAIKDRYPGTAGYMTQEEASKISKDVVRAAIENKQDVVLDTGGDSGYEKLKAKLDSYRAAGHRIVANYATLPTEEAWRRAYDRGQRTHLSDGSPNPDHGRYVPKPILATMHANISRDFERSVDLFDDIKLWSGPGYPGVAGGKPRLIASGGRGKPLKIHDRELYTAFLAKARITAADLPDYPMT